MIVTPLALAQLSSKIYSSSDFDNYWIIDDVVVGHNRVGDTDVLVLRGSLTAEDWLRDACAVPEWHQQLGFCHSGFLDGMDHVFEEVRALVGQRVAITGHSLGGARSRILAGLFAYNKIPVDNLTVFGSPKPAFINLARIIQKSGMAHSSYRFGRDIVPDVPLSIEPFLNFTHTESYATLDGHSDPDDFSPLRDHGIANYIAALTQSTQAIG